MRMVCIQGLIYTILLSIITTFTAIPQKFVHFRGLRVVEYQLFCRVVVLQNKPSTFWWMAVFCRLSTSLISTKFVVKGSRGILFRIHTPLNQIWRCHNYVHTVTNIREAPRTTDHATRAYENRATICEGPVNVRVWCGWFDRTIWNQNIQGILAPWIINWPDHPRHRGCGCKVGSHL